MNYQAIDVHLALPAGLYRYEPAGHVLCFEVPRDLRAVTGNQDFTAEAALDLVFVADDSRVQVQGDSARTTPTRRQVRWRRTCICTVLGRAWRPCSALGSTVRAEMKLGVEPIGHALEGFLILQPRGARSDRSDRLSLG
jgi:hypothetical protein